MQTIHVIQSKLTEAAKSEAFIASLLIVTAEVSGLHLGDEATAGEVIDERLVDRRRCTLRHRVRVHRQW